ncbi:enoyl-CoA hydratase [Massilia sp. CCM 8695]|uniref:Enoyl-CoA hydratase n=1 Tax=Massilia frigida TaxID=2609281 RepID=A0ABX0N7P0_9BURK|nr:MULTISPECIES: enoyl-CoA hydratase-related protein [Massilia]MDM5177610.1 enoyl-CoA hydratase-related protein [Massilia sp. DJPM01]NHZ81421.1 enoyl-CoA hydratase [Massilia frigida]
MGVKLQKQGRLLTITLDKPDANNTLDAALLGQISAALDQAEADPLVRVVALCANGPVFCSGADLGGSASCAPAEAAQQYFRLLRRFASSPCIIVALVEGAVQAGGVGLVAASDYVICTEAASFRLPEVLLGLIPACVLPFLIRRLGAHNSQMLALTAHKIDARRAVELHLADQLAPQGHEALRRLVLSVERIPETAVATLKHYMGQLAPITDRDEQLAVASIAALMQQPGSLDRTRELIEHGLWGGKTA